MSRSFFWVRRQVNPIGIDLGSRCIRMLQLAEQRGQLAVVALRQRELPPGDRSSVEYDALRIEALKEMLKDNAFSGRDVVTALSWEHTQARNLRIPMMPETEVQQVVQFESADRFELNSGEDEIRFLVAGDVRQGMDIRQEIITFGADRAHIESEINILKQAGLRPVAIDAGACAVFRGFERFLRRDGDQNKVNMFVDLGYGGTRVIVSRGPDPIFFKPIPVGGRVFDKLTSEALNLTLDESSRIRKRLHRQHLAELTETKCAEDHEPVGEHVRAAILDAIRPALEQLSKEIALCLRYCSVTFRGLRSEVATAVGGEAADTGVLRILSEQVNVPFRLGRPMHNIDTAVVTDGIDRRSGHPEWATAIGLALKPVKAIAEVTA